MLGTAAHLHTALCLHAQFSGRYFTSLLPVSG